MSKYLLIPLKKAMQGMAFFNGCDTNAGTDDRDTIIEIPSHI